jgi:pyruvate,orthophosphate dikinase
VWHLAENSTGENIFNGEYLVNAQGEVVVSGVRTPQQITIGSKVGGGWCSEQDRKARNTLHWKSDASVYNN